MDVRREMQRVFGRPVDAALTRTQRPPRPVSIRLIPVLAHTVVLPTPGRDNLDRVGTIQAGTVERNAFRQGYQDYMGNPVWEDRFIDVILNCENKTYGWVWRPSASSYITVAQFHPDTWARASAATGLDDPYNLYHVGAAVAYWSVSIEHPGASGGWPGCW